MAYERIIAGLENKEYKYSAAKANAAIVFIENFCHHHEGKLAPQKIKLELWQKAFISVIFGIIDDTGARQFREVFLVVARKNGKTLLAAAIAEYMTFLDGEYGGRIYFAAPKLEQANLCYNAYFQMIKKEPVLDKMARKRRTDIYVEELNTTAKPLAFSAKKSDGLNVSLCVADEVAGWQGDPGLKFYEVIKSSVGAREQPIILSISTAGYVSDGIFDELIKRSTRYLLGDSRETRLCPFLYMIDDVEKWADINELQKSNPNLGVSISVDFLLEEIAIAQGSLSKKTEFLTKMCNVKQNSSQAWLPAQSIAACCTKENEEAPRLEDFRNCYCVAGIDLSRTTDLTAACVIIERDSKLYTFSKFWLPEEKIEEAIARDGLPYRIFQQRGLLDASGDNFVDYNDCYKWLCELVEKYKIYPLKVGYDRYNALQLTQALTAYGFQCDDVYQGYNLSPVIDQTEGLIKDAAFRIGDNDLLKVHLLNASTKVEAESGKRKLIKLNAAAHIDGAAAMLDAMTVRQKWWGEIGRQLQNKR